MKKIALLLLMTLLLALPAQAAEEGAGRYYVPPSQFNVELQVMDVGASHVFGLFRNATGSFEYEPSGKRIGNIKLAIDASSILSSNPENTSDLMVLVGTPQFPEIVFVTREVATFSDGKADIKGFLTFHGASKPLTLQATLNHAGKNPRGGGLMGTDGEAVGLSLTGSFKRADFGITDDPNMRSRFGDDISLRLELQAIRQ